MKHRMSALVAILLLITLIGCGEEIRDTGPLVQRQVQLRIQLPQRVSAGDLFRSKCHDDRNKYQI